jgi:uncharacterized DUF497 family protein
MEFDWDETKSDACFLERGFDFNYAAHAFFDKDRLIQKDTRFDYGEDRYQTIGIVEGRVFFVTYTIRGLVIRIISARKANKKEVKNYENSDLKN